MNTHTNTDITTSTEPRCARFFRVQKGQRVEIVGSADGYIPTKGMNHAQSEVAEQLNAELEQRLCLAAFGTVDATVLGECGLRPGQPTLVPMRPYSPKGAKDAREIVATLGLQRKLIGRAAARAVNTLRDHPNWLPREAAVEAAEYFG